MFKISLILISLLASTAAQADNIIRISAPIQAAYLSHPNQPEATKEITQRLNIVPGKYGNLGGMAGVGFRRQASPGVYNLGKSIDNFDNGMYAAVSYVQYGSSINASVQILSARSESLNVSSPNPAFTSYLNSYKGFRLLKSDGSVYREHLFTGATYGGNYYMKWVPISKSVLADWFNNPSIVTALELFGDAQ